MSEKIRTWGDDARECHDCRIAFKRNDQVIDRYSEQEYGRVRIVVHANCIVAVARELQDFRREVREREKRQNDIEFARLMAKHDVPRAARPPRVYEPEEEDEYPIGVETPAKPTTPSNSPSGDKPE